MILVAGLGNPGPRYAETRHNAGFWAIDHLASAQPALAWKARFHGQFAPANLAGQGIGLLKPETFMNESGRSVLAALTFFKLAPADVVVIHDELDLPLGEVRLKQGGGHAGNNGVRSIAGAIGPAFVRVRVGIGRPDPSFRGDIADFVLSSLPPADRTVLQGAVAKAAEVVSLLVAQGLPAAMNVTNQRAPQRNR